METSIKENIAVVEKIIAEECKKAGRPVDDVTLIAVSKTKPVEILVKTRYRNYLISMK